MLPLLKTLHSYLAWILLPLLMITILTSLFLMIRRKPFTERFRKLTLVVFIAAHIQLLIGLILYFFSPMGFSAFSGEAMSNSLMRLYLVEHPFAMILGIILISIGYIRAKKPGDDVRRLRTIFIFYSVGLFLLLIRIPWHVWPF